MAARDGQNALEQYDHDGFVIFRNIIDDDLIKEMNAHVEWLQARHPERALEQLGHDLMTNDPFWVRVVSDDRLVDIAQLFVGPDIALFASHYICKPAYTGQPVRWHQDGAFWPLEPMNVVTLWLAVDASTPQNGCVRLVPGSHKRDFADMRDSAGDDVLGKEIAVDVDESQAVDMVLKPGDVEVHHPNIVHGSNANTSPNRRCGLTIRYIPTSTEIVSDDLPWPSAFLLRGSAGVNAYQRRPHWVEGEHMPFRGHEAWL